MEGGGDGRWFLGPSWRRRSSPSIGLSPKGAEKSAIAAKSNIGPATGKAFAVCRASGHPLSFNSREMSDPLRLTLNGQTDRYWRPLPDLSRAVVKNGRFLKILPRGTDIH